MTATVDIVAVDPADRDGYAEFHAVYEAACRFGPQGEYSVPWTLDEARVALADDDERRFRSAWAGWMDGTVVVTGWLEGSMVDNTDMAHVQVCCAPDHRGHGHAAAMLAHAGAAEGEHRRSLTRR